MARFFSGMPLRTLLIISLLTYFGVSANALTLALSDTERSHLQQLGTVKFCVDPDWSPFEVIDDTDQHVGIAADLLALVAERTGLPLRLLKTKSWTESLEASRTGRCQLISLLNQTPERDAWLIFTQPILTDDNILITREDHPFVVDLDSLQGQTMVLPKGTSIEERVRREFPQLKIIVTDSEAQALQMVSDRKASMTMRSLIVAAYTIKREGWFNLKIAGHEVRTPLAVIDASTQVLMLRLKADTDKLPLVQRIHRGAATRVAQKR
jgi:ABC-type amino acid transport substrate-binding protein